MEKSNIVMFVADQMRSDALHHLGNQSSITPYMDQLAEEGISFKNAYCQNPVCVPSRCSFLSGLYPHTTGHRTMHYLQRAYEQNIFREMKNNGYEVIWIGRNDLLMPGLSKEEYCDEFYNGVDEFIHMEDLEKYKYPTCDYDTPEVMQDDNIYSFYHGCLDKEQAKKTFDWNCVNTAIRYLKQRSKENQKPFFLYISVLFPHPPYECEEPWFSSIDRNHLSPRRSDIDNIEKPTMLKEIRQKQQLHDWDECKFNELRATYLAMVSRFDHQAGMLCDTLKSLKLYDDTNIFIFSDHGDYTGDYGIVEKVQNCFDDPICNVPLIIKPAKQNTKEIGVCKDVVELVDIPSTLADIAGFSLSYTQFGESLMKYFRGEKREKDIVLCEGGRLPKEEQAMEKGHGKESPYWPRLSTQEEEGAQHTKAVMIRKNNIKYVLRLYEEDELYDLNNDPMELHNLIHEDAYHQVASDMRYCLLKRLFETSDIVPVVEDQRLNW